MKRFLVVQHSYSEFLGGVETQLESRDIGFSYVRPFTGQALPASALQYDALWLLGGAYPVCDSAHCPWVADELRLVSAFRRARRPVVGLGFGGLVVAAAAGGTPYATPAHRACFTTAHRAGTASGEPLADALDGRRVLVMVNGRVELPAGLAPILVDDQGDWIAVRPDPLTYGLLFRPELKPGMLEDMVMEEGRESPDHIGELIAGLRADREAVQRNQDATVAALVTALDLMKERKKPPVFVLNPVNRES
jgi:GMP synthase-like glutamine amidotransferase